MWVCKPGRSCASDGAGRRRPPHRKHAGMQPPAQQRCSTQPAAGSAAAGRGTYLLGQVRRQALQQRAAPRLLSIRAMAQHDAQGADLHRAQAGQHHPCRRQARAGRGARARREHSFANAPLGDAGMRHARLRGVQHAAQHSTAQRCPGGAAAPPWLSRDSLAARSACSAPPRSGPPAAAVGKGGQRAQRRQSR